MLKPLDKTFLNIIFSANQQRSLIWLNVDVGAAQQVTVSGGTTSLKSSTKRKKRLMKPNKLLSNLTADMGGASAQRINKKKARPEGPAASDTPRERVHIDR